MSRDFYDLCYDQYKLEIDHADQIYQRAGVLLIVLPVLCGAAISVSRIDLLPRLFTRVDLFIYYIAAGATFAFLR